MFLLTIIVLQEKRLENGLLSDIVRETAEEKTARLASRPQNMDSAYDPNNDSDELDKFDKALVNGHYRYGKQQPDDPSDASSIASENTPSLHSPEEGDESDNQEWNSSEDTPESCELPKKKTRIASEEPEEEELNFSSSSSSSSSSFSSMSSIADVYSSGPQALTPLPLPVPSPTISPQESLIAQLQQDLKMAQAQVAESKEQLQKAAVEKKKAVEDGLAWRKVAAQLISEADEKKTATEEGLLEVEKGGGKEEG